ncbi:MAG: hypothetical protein NTZ80_01085 [Patescibacteria group bacterium]|nr:hypothetical protein [Patescibacteria group bacterium]
MKRHAPHYFGEIENGAVILNECGEVAARFWQEIPNHFGYARLDEWIVMPNHVHGIIWIENNTVGNCHGNSLQNIKPRRFQLIPIIINHFKSAVTREIRRQNLDVNFAWQKSFYDRIIRDDDELNRIREYIIQNPVKW